MSELTNGQEQAVGELAAFFDKPANGEIHLLSGFAGCGKTWTIAHMRKEGIIRGKTVMCAPTHKAVRVLHRNFGSQVDADFSTIHSLLMVRPTEDDGHQTFVSYARPGMNIPIHRYDNVILDETSMLEDELFETLLAYKSRNTRLLLSGDSFQLQPVGHQAGVKAAAFTDPQKYNIVTHTLDEIVRQKDGNSIIPFSAQIRGHVFPERKDWGANVRDMSRPAMGQYALKIFRAEAYRHNRDLFRYLAWTNATVDRFNDQVHGVLQPRGEMTDPIAIGEVMILRAPYEIDRDHSFQNNDELEVLDRENMTWELEYEHESIFLKASLPVSLCSAVNTEGMEGKIMISLDDQAWQAVMKKLDNRIRYTKLENKGMAWKQFWNLNGKIATWKHSYAQTIHTAQGSTFCESGIDAGDVRKCRTEEYWHLLYTGVTRSSDLLTIV